MTKKYVKNYQNKLFFVPNLGVKPTKNRIVRSLCGVETFRALSKRHPLEDHIVDISPVVLALSCQSRPLPLAQSIHVVFPC